MNPKYASNLWQCLDQIGPVKKKARPGEDARGTEGCPSHLLLPLHVSNRYILAGEPL